MKPPWDLANCASEPPNWSIFLPTKYSPPSPTRPTLASKSTGGGPTRSDAGRIPLVSVMSRETEFPLRLLVGTGRRRTPRETALYSRHARPFACQIRRNKLIQTAEVTGNRSHDPADGADFSKVTWIVWDFATRGGFSLRFAGFGLVLKDGRLAPRWRCGWRSLVTWAPLTALLITSIWFDNLFPKPAWKKLGSSFAATPFLNMASERPEAPAIASDLKAAAEDP